MMPTFTDTPVATTVVTPRLRRVWSREVAVKGVRPCPRAAIRSLRSSPSSGTSRAPSLPARVGAIPCSRRSLSASPRIRQLTAVPAPSSRVCTTQWTTRAPTPRAASHTAAAARTVPAADTRSTRALIMASGPTTPLCSSMVRTAVEAGSTSAASPSGSRPDGVVIGSPSSCDQVWHAPNT